MSLDESSCGEKRTYIPLAFRVKNNRTDMFYQNTVSLGWSAPNLNAQRLFEMPSSHLSCVQRLTECAVTIHFTFTVSVADNLLQSTNKLNRSTLDAVVHYITEFLDTSTKSAPCGFLDFFLLPLTLFHGSYLFVN